MRSGVVGSNLLHRTVEVIPPSAESLDRRIWPLSTRRGRWRPAWTAPANHPHGSTGRSGTAREGYGPFLEGGPTRQRLAFPTARDAVTAPQGIPPQLNVQV